MTPSDESEFDHNPKPVENLPNKEETDEAVIDLTEVGSEGTYIELNGTIMQIREFAPGEYVVFVPDGFELVQENVNNSVDEEFSVEK